MGDCEARVYGGSLPTCSPLSGPQLALLQLVGYTGRNRPIREVCFISSSGIHTLTWAIAKSGLTAVTKPTVRGPCRIDLTKDLVVLNNDAEIECILFPPYDGSREATEGKNL